VKFSIVTPSFRHSEWLKLCVASVHDQAGVELEHIVQDAGSDDGTLDWLPHDPRVKAIVEKDHGMYDAINRGFRRASGDVLAYLNCDEQYLPGALKSVADYFATHPEVDFVIADAVVVDMQGEYICHRFALTPLKSHLWHRFSVLTCAMFLRRRVVQELGLYFDPQWRALGDAFWIKEIAYRGVRTGVLRRFTSTFTETGENLSLTPTAERERAAKELVTPVWVKRFAPLIVLHHRLRLLASGAFFVKPFDYELYTQASPDRRACRRAARPTPRWKGRSG
jgi:glycosyltransferase involved in cell wall biosynthesis